MPSSRGRLGAIAGGNAQRLLDRETLHLFHGERVAQVGCAASEGTPPTSMGLRSLSVTICGLSAETAATLSIRFSSSRTLPGNA